MKHRGLIFLILLSLILLSLSACTTVQTTDWEADQLLGQVKQLKTTTGEAVVIADSLTFGKYAYTEIVNYDRQGLKINALTFDDNSFNLQCNYEHNKAGKITVADMLDADGKPVMRNEYDYNASNQLTKMRSVDAENHVDLTIVYSNDSLGREIAQSLYDHLGRLVRTELTEYGTNNQPLRQITISNPADSLIATFTYNEDNLLARTEELNAGKNFFSTTDYLYDSHQNIISEIITRDTTVIQQTIRFEYDSVGNWTRKTVYHQTADGTLFPTFLWIREIEYWK